MGSAAAAAEVVAHLHGVPGVVRRDVETMRQREGLYINSICKSKPNTVGIPNRAQKKSAVHEVIVRGGGPVLLNTRAVRTN
jgi:hypothetical protein